MERFLNFYRARFFDCHGQIVADQILCLVFYCFSRFIFTIILIMICYFRKKTSLVSSKQNLNSKSVTPKYYRKFLITWLCYLFKYSSFFLLINIFYVLRCFKQDFLNRNFHHSMKQLKFKNLSKGLI